ncbi:MAG: hypothetical protein WBB74_06070 [Gaiellaceae bacterium]
MRSGALESSPGRFRPPSKLATKAERAHAIGGTLDQVASKPPLRPGLLVLLSLAVFLLGVGALPRTVVPHPRAAALLAQHRLEIAAGGAAAFVAFLVAYFVH